MIVGGLRPPRKEGTGSLRWWSMFALLFFILAHGGMFGCADDMEIGLRCFGATSISVTSWSFSASSAEPSDSRRLASTMLNGMGRVDVPMPFGFGHMVSAMNVLNGLRRCVSWTLLAHDDVTAWWLECCFTDELKHGIRLFGSSSSGLTLFLRYSLSAFTCHSW